MIPTPPFRADAKYTLDVDTALTARRLFSTTTILLGAFALAIPVMGALSSTAVPWPLKAACGFIALASGFRPVWGLLILIAILPLDTYIWALLDPPFETVAIGEMFVTSCLSAACGRLALMSSRPAGWLSSPALTLGAVIAASGAFTLGGFQLATAWPDVFVRDFWRHLTGSYFTDRATFAPFHLAFNWIEGLTLAVVAERLTREQRAAWPALTRMFAAGALAAAIPSSVRLAEVSLRQLHPLSAARQFLRTLRIPGILNDFNAVGALLAIYLVAIVWLARRRPSYWPITVPLFLALWLTGSRGAQVAAVLSLGILWFITQPRRAARIGVAAGFASVVLALVLWNQGRQAQSSSSVALETRVAMAKVGFQVAAEEPIFGVGLGQFRRISRRFIPEELIRLFPQTAVGENAHNNFIQILAELGSLGLAGFLWLIAAFFLAVRRGSLTAGSVTAPDVSLALAGGVLALLLSCLASHPLLITEVLWIFLLVTGLAAGFNPQPPARYAAWARRIAVAAAVVLAISVPIRLWQYRQVVDLEGVIIGARAETDTLDRIEYRFVDQRSGWFIPSSSRLVEIPLRATAESTVPCRVRIDIDGRQVNTVEASAGGWTSVVLELPEEGHAPRSRRLGLLAESEQCRLMVGVFKLRAAGGG